MNEVIREPNIKDVVVQLTLQGTKKEHILTCLEISSGYYYRTLKDHSGIAIEVTTDELERIIQQRRDSLEELRLKEKREMYEKYGIVQEPYVKIKEPRGVYGSKHEEDILEAFEGGCHTMKLLKEKLGLCYNTIKKILDANDMKTSKAVRPRRNITIQEQVERR